MGFRSPHPRRYVTHERKAPRSFYSSSKRFQNPSPQGTPLETAHHNTTSTPLADLEATARNARNLFGNTLPADFLSSEEYIVYERLYGAPLRATAPEDLEILRNLHEVVEEGNEGKDVLFRENEEGDLEEIEFRPGNHGNDKESFATLQPGTGGSVEEVHVDVRGMGQREVEALRRLQQDMAAAVAAQPEVNDDPEYEPEEDIEEDDEDNDDHEGDEDEPDLYTGHRQRRGHPLTEAGKFRVPEGAVQLPKDTFTMPIKESLSAFSTTQLKSRALSIFGGPGLPFSAATPVAKRTMGQRPIALNSSENMSSLDASLYMAAVMSGTYASTYSTLVEVRKRLGKEWLRGLLHRKEAPHILDAGTGGAAVVAWRELLKAEWETMQEDKNTASTSQAPIGKATVAVGASTIREGVKRFLDSTTFLPRLPDNIAPLNADILDNPKAPRKQYDVILAAHTLWPLGQDWERKQQVQKLWSLLNPAGGVLIFIEKGLPEGFKAIGAARQLILSKYLDATSSTTSSSDLSEPTNPPAVDDPPSTKEPGSMIIAPCTNHAPCPMLDSSTPPSLLNRRQFCHFRQRFHRPPYYQTLVGATGRNHEDAQFSYVAVRRGHPHFSSPPALLASTQNAQSTINAFDGAFSPGITDPGREAEMRTHMQTLPRVILPPLKRHRHVILDVCTSAGGIERWTVPKSYGREAYRDARKAQWGDLWALGAKTRVDRKRKQDPRERNVEKKEIHKGRVRSGTRQILIRKGVKGGRKMDGGREGKGKGTEV